MPRHYVILGAGISGLSAGWFIKQKLCKNDQLTILESSNRTGGWIQTLEVNNFLFEQGPRSCRTKQGQETLELIESLQLENEVIIPHQQAENRYIYQNNQLQKTPGHFWQIPFHKLTNGWGRALWNDLTHSKRTTDDESIADFFTRRLSKDWMNRFIDPMVLGIFAGNCHQLSLKSCFPLFDQWEQTEGSLLRGAFKSKKLIFPSTFMQSMQKYPLFSFKKGMSTLTDALEKNLKNHIHLNSDITSIQSNSNGFELLLNHQEKIQATHVISTIPLYSLRKYFPQFLNELNWLKYASVSVVNIGFDKIDADLNGFGYLIPSYLNSPILGCVWDSSIFPEQNTNNHQTRLTMMLGGTHHPEVDMFEDEKLINISLEALFEHCGIKKSPSVIQIKRTREAIPQYEIGYDKWKTSIISKMKNAYPFFSLSGNAFSGVSINDCISQAKNLTNEL